MRGVRFRPRAQRHLLEAARWYEGQEPGLGGALLESIDELLRNLRQFPQQYTLYSRGIRRAVLIDFPFLIFYKVLQDEILVIECVHSRRDPLKWPK